MPPEAKLRMRNVGKYANTCSYIHIYTLLLFQTGSLDSI